MLVVIVRVRASTARAEGEPSPVLTQLVWSLSAGSRRGLSPRRSPGDDRGVESGRLGGKLQADCGADIRARGVVGRNMVRGQDGVLHAHGCIDVI